MNNCACAAFPAFTELISFCLIKSDPGISANRMVLFVAVDFSPYGLLIENFPENFFVRFTQWDIPPAHGLRGSFKGFVQPEGLHAFRSAPGERRNKIRRKSAP